MKGGRIVQEPKKQIITREIIEKELSLQKIKFINRHLRRTVPYFLILDLFILPFAIIVVSNMSTSIILKVVLFLLVFMPVSVIAFVLKDYTGFEKALKCGSYYFFVDRVKTKYETSCRTSIIREDYSFVFAKKGYNNNLSSVYFNSSEEGVFNNSTIGDSFY